MSFNRYLSALVGTASTIALIYAQPALAQQAAQSDQPAASAETGLEEVVVTARRREEKAQTVPITINAVSQAQLQDQNIRTATDLNKEFTSVQICCNRGAVSFTWIRGVPGVNFYLNGVNVNPGGSGLYFDLDNSQLLKGPQGTLFGESTDAGAILFEAKKPANDFEGYAQAEAGSYGHIGIEGVLNVPVVADKLIVRAGAQVMKTDGYVHDYSTNQDFYDENYWVGRIQATFRPSDDFENNIFVNYYNNHSHGTTFVWTLVNPTGLAGLIFGGASFTGLNGQTQKGFVNAFNQQLTLGKYGVLGTSAPGSYSRMSQWNIIDTANYDLSDDFSIKNIAAYQEFENAGYTDTDGTPFGILDGNTRLANGTVLPHAQANPNVQYTDDLQFLGKLFDDKVNFTLGTLNEWLGGRAPTAPGYTTTLGSVNGSLSYGSTRTDAVYGQFTYNLSDLVEGLSFTGGARWTVNKVEFRQDSYAGTTQTISKSVGLRSYFRGPTYDLSLDYQIDPTTMFYVTNAHGYRVGGFNPNGPSGFQEFLPESLDNVEIGVKSDMKLAGMSIRTDLSAFYGNYSNIQTQVTSAVPNPSGGPPLLQVLTENSATAHIEGVEAQITIIPVQELELNANVAYDYDKYDKYQSLNSAGVPQDLSNTPFVEDPKFMWRLSGTYHLPIDQAYGRLSFTAIWNYQTSQINTAVLPVLPAYITPAFGQVDLSLDWRDVWGTRGLDATVYGTNILGNAYTNGPFGVYSALGIFGITPDEPPMWGVRLRYSFGGGGTHEEAVTTAYVPPAPQPVQPAAPKSYLVFFDFDKSDLTSAGRQIVDQAAMNAPAAKVTQIAVTGHTDTVGSDEYNMRLSKRRALSVAAELEAHGVPESEIAIVAKGKRDPLVPTGDGVREPQNRRVEIVYGGGASS